MQKRAALVLAALLAAAALCCPRGAASSPAPHNTVRHKRSLASSADDLSSLLSSSTSKEAAMEQLLDEKRHLKHSGSSIYGAERLLWIRSGECPDVEDGTKGFFCPTPDAQGQWRCITEFQLCDHMRDCPNAEDEHPTHCLFYSVIQAHFSKLTRSLLLRSLVSRHNHI